MALLTTPITNHDINQAAMVAQRLTIYATHLSQDISIKGVLLFIVSAATEFGYTITDLINRLVDICAEIPQLSSQLIQQVGKLISNVCGGSTFRSTTPGTEELELTSELTDTLIATFGEPETIATLTSMLAGLSAIIASAIVGVKSFKPTKSMLTNLSSYGREISGLNSGLKALIELVSNFSRIVNDQVLAYFGSSPSSATVAAVESLRVPFNDGILTAQQLFEDITFYLTEEGENKMAMSKKDIKHARFCSTVINQIVVGSINKRFDIPASAISQMQQLQKNLDWKVKLASNKTLSEPRRFSPFCIWLYGPPGTGKSEVMSKLSTSLMENLAKRAQYFEVPPPERYSFPCSFSSKFKTGYNGHYVVTYDDMCQDKSGSTNSTSVMEFIQWVSCIPVNVEQAAVEDKYCPFDSKIVICSSNVSHPRRTEEIVEPVALFRRRNMLIECLPSTEKDSVLDWPIKFVLRDSIDMKQPPIREYRNFAEFFEHVFDSYKEHYDNQEALRIKSNTPYLIDMDAKMPLLQDEIDRNEEEIELVETEVVTQSEDLQATLVPSGKYVRNADALHEVIELPSGSIYVPRHICRLPMGDIEQAKEHLARALFTVRNLSTSFSVRYQDLVGHVVFCPPDHPDVCFTLNSDELDEIIEMSNFSIVDDVIEYSYEYVFSILGEQDLEPTIGWFRSFPLDLTVDRYAFLHECVEASKALKRWLNNIMMRPMWQYIAAFSGLAVLYASVQAYKDWRGFYDLEPSYDKNIIRQKPKPKVKASSTKPAPMPELLHPTSANFASSVLTKNVACIETSIGRANVLFVRGRTFLTCRHVFSNMVEGEQFSIIFGDLRYTLSYSKSNCVRVGDNVDAVLYKCDVNMRQFKDITDKFMKSGQYMAEHFMATIASKVPTEGLWYTQFSVGTQDRYLSVDSGRESVIKYYRGEGCNDLGNSGSPLIVFDGVNRAPAVLGIQFARTTRVPAVFVEPVCYEDLIAALEPLEITMGSLEGGSGEELFYDCSDNLQEFFQAVRHNVEFIGREEPIHMSSTTSLRASEIANHFVKDPLLKQYAPAALSGKSEGVSVDMQHKDPLLLSMKGFGIPYGAFDRQVGRIVLSEFQREDKIVRRYPNISMRLLSNSEILNGIPGILKGVELSTSPGLPYLRKRHQKGKLDWISMDAEGVRTMKQEVWDDVANLEELARTETWDTDLLSYACLKDELRPVERVAACKTRTFIVLPMHYNLLLRKYFGTWIAVQHKLAGNIASCVGIDANSEWNRIYNKLNDAGSDMEDFDYSEWDRTLHAEWFEMYADRVSEMYGDKPRSDGWKIRRYLMEYLIHMKILVKDFVIRTHGGNKSGCAITAEINSDVHDMLMYYVWYKVAMEHKKTRYLSLAQFRANCSIVVYGDDIIKSTNPPITSWFNGNNIRKVVQQLGMDITPATKTDTEFTVKTIDQVSFLKRGFMVVDDDCGLVRAPLDKSVIQRMVLWTHKNDDPVLATKLNIEGAVRESFYWGERYYNEFVKKCNDAWACRFQGVQYCPSLDLPAYSTMEAAFRRREFDWAPVLFDDSRSSL